MVTDVSKPKDPNSLLLSDAVEQLVEAIAHDGMHGEEIPNRPEATGGYIALGFVLDSRLVRASSSFPSPPADIYIYIWTLLQCIWTYSEPSSRLRTLY